jgi:hypothetical protein
MEIKLGHMNSAFYIEEKILDVRIFLLSETADPPFSFSNFKPSK